MRSAPTRPLPAQSRRPPLRATHVRFRSEIGAKLTLSPARKTFPDVAANPAQSPQSALTSSAGGAETGDVTTFALTTAAAAPVPTAAPDTATRASPTPTPVDAVAADGRLARRYARLALALCLAVHVWLISAGLWAYWPQYTARHDLLARGFAAGQTSLLIEPDPRHLALPDPYDPATNDRYRQQPGIPDSCLYGGKLYLYWGPVPALLLTPARWVLDADTRVGDQFLTFAFVQGMMLATAALLLRARAGHFPRSPAWLPAVGVAVAGLTAPVTCVLTRAAVYEVAIVGGQCFLLAGIYLAWTAAGRPHRRPAATLALAGACLACAAGCRVSLAVAVAAVGVLVCGRIVWGSRRRPADAILPLLAFGLPLAAGAAGLAAYNRVRFDAWLEFGQRYQLAGVNLRSYPSLFGLANVWPGLWSYFLRPVAAVGQFPYLLMAAGDGTFPDFIRLPEHYESYERIGGLLWTVPVVWLVPLGIAALAFRRLRSTAVGGTTPQPLVDPTSHGPGDRTAGDLRWLILVLTAAAVLGFVPVLLMIGSSQRYLADLTPPLEPVLMILVWRLTGDRAASPRAARRWLALTVSLAGVSAVAGVLLAVEGYAGHFRIQHPELFDRLSGPVPSTGAAGPPSAPAGPGSADASSFPTASDAYVDA
jgi:hypothetical protein